MRPTLDQWAMDLAKATARRSTCLRRSVGCVLLDVAGKVLATGYNGVAKGAAHCNEAVAAGRDRHTIDVTFPHACAGAGLPSGTGLELCEAVHAEQNALLQCSDVTKVHACYSTTAPCVTCTKLLLNTGCGRVVFSEDYPTSGRDLWVKSGPVGGQWMKL